MKGAIVVNGYYKSESYSHQVSRLLEEFSFFSGVSVEIYENKRAVEAKDAFDYDFAVFLDKDINLARVMENNNVVLFNNSFAIENTDDKVKTACVLAQSDDIVFPPTIFTPTKYTVNSDEDFLRQTAERLGYPVIVKTNRGSLGTGVFMAKTFEELQKIDKSLGVTEHFYQKYVSESCGKSVRIIVIGGAVVAAMELNNAQDFRSNANLGGVGKSVKVNDVYKKTAEAVSKALDLDYCGVDFFVGAPIVLEVNSNAYFKEMERVSGVNIAAKYVEYIIKTMGEIIL